MSDLVTGSILGIEFDLGSIQAGKIRLKLGAGLAISPTGVISATGLPASSTIEVDQSFLASSTVTGDANQPNTILTQTQVRADTGWSLTANAWTYTGNPDKVRVDANLYMEENTAATLARIAPQLELLRNGVVVAKGSDYARHATGHDDNHLVIAYTDPNPGTNPVYQLRAQQGGAQTDVLQIDIGSFSLDAVEKVEVFSPMGQQASGLLDPCADARLNFFNEQQFSWAFSIQNTSANPVLWQFVIEGADYQLNPNSILNNNLFAYQEVDNANGTYDHVFTAVGSLAPFGTTPSFSIPGVNFGRAISSQNNAVNC
jgi:hypothetical protein